MQELLRQKQSDIEDLVNALCMLWQATSSHKGVSITQQQLVTKLEQCSPDQLVGAGPASSVPVAALRHALLHDLLQQLARRVGEEEVSKHEPNRQRQLRAKWKALREERVQPRLHFDATQHGQVAIAKEAGYQEIQGQQQLILQMQSSISTAMQLLRQHMTDLHRAGSGTCPAYAGHFDMSQPTALPEYSKTMTQTFPEHTFRDSQSMTDREPSVASRPQVIRAAGCGWSVSTIDGEPAEPQDTQQLQQTNSLLLRGRILGCTDAGDATVLLNREVDSTAVHASVEVPLQLPGRDQALHCLSTQLLAIQGQLAELQDYIAAGHRSQSGPECCTTPATPASSRRRQQQVSEFPSREFYAGRLKDAPGMAQQTAQPWHEHALFGPFAVIDVPGAAYS